MNGSILTIIAISSLTLGASLINGAITESETAPLASTKTITETNLRRGSKQELDLERNAAAISAINDRRGTRSDADLVIKDPTTGSLVPRRGSRDLDQG